MPDRISQNHGQHTWMTAELRRKQQRHINQNNGPIESVNTVTASGSAQTLPDVGTATMHDITLTANCTFTFPAAGAGKSFSVRLVQDGTGSRTVTWPAAARWMGGLTPALSTAAGAVDCFAAVCFDGTHFEMFFAGKGMA